MTLLGGRSRFIVLRSQRTLTGEAKDTKSGVMCVLASVYFIGRTSCGEPFLTGEKSGVTKFQLSLRAQCELQSRFVGSLINASTEAFLLLGAERKIPIATKIFGFQSRYAGNNDIHHSTDFVDIGGNSVHLSKNCEGKEFSFKWSH